MSTADTVKDPERAAARAYLLLRHLRGDIDADGFTAVGRALGLFEETPQHEEEAR